MTGSDEDCAAAVSASASASATAVATALGKGDATAAADAFASATTQDTAKAQASAIAEAYTSGDVCCFHAVSIACMSPPAFAAGCFPSAQVELLLSQQCRALALSPWIQRLVTVVQLGSLMPSRLSPPRWPPPWQAPSLRIPRLQLSSLPQPQQVSPWPSMHLSSMWAEWTRIYHIHACELKRLQP